MMAFIPIPVFIPRQEVEMPYFPKSEYEIKREYEERKRAERIEKNLKGKLWKNVKK